MAHYERFPRMGKVGEAAEKRSQPASMKAGLYILACMLLCTALIALGCVDQALAETSCDIHVSYQWYRTDADVTEDYEVFDTAAAIEGTDLRACVMPDTPEWDERCSWRVMKNFAGGIQSGEEDISSEASYDESTGMLTLPATRAGDDLTIVFVMPWDHASHAEHGHWRGNSYPSTAGRLFTMAQTNGLLSASASGFEAGTVYPLSIVSGANGLESDPTIYGSDTNVSGAGTVMGYPEFNGRYKFYVSFSEGNCALFSQLGQVPGRQGNGGIIYGGSGTPYDYSWAAYCKWCAADCVENVYNTAGMPVPLAGAGSWVRIDSIDGNSLNCTFRIECNNPDGSNAQDIMGTFSLEVPKGAISFSKTSASESLTQANACYSLAGATYGIFETEDAANARDETRMLNSFVTDASGTWTSGSDYDPGTYYISELSAPTGFKLSDEVIAVTVEAGATVEASAADEPFTSPRMQVQKIDAVTKSSSPQGNATLEGAEITFRYYDGYYTAETLPETPTRTWVMKTGSDGVASPHDAESMRASGDEFYRSGEGDVELPLGTISVIETKAPEGYALGTPKLYVAQITADSSSGEASIAALNYSGSEASESNAPIIADEPETGTGEIVKVDSTFATATPQGDASLESATFEVVNASANPVVVNGCEYPVGSVVMELTTGSDGKATTGRVLPFGSYLIREKSAPTGYLLDGNWSETLTIDGDEQVKSVTAADVVMRGNIVLIKTEGETGQRTAQGDATLAGACYDIINRSACPVASPQTGEEVAPGSVVCTIVTDESGYAATGNASVNGWTIPADFDGKALAYGTYEVVEQSPAGGYLINTGFTITIEERADGQISSIETSDLVERGRLVVGKTSRDLSQYLDQGAASLEGWSFEIVNQSAHCVVVDGAEYEPGEVVKVITTNWVDGICVADTGERCLPYGTYEVHEIQTMRPQDNGYLFDEVSQHWSKSFTIESDGETVDYTGTSNACGNQVVRGDLSMTKAESPTMKRLSGIPFKVTSATTGEWHVLVTDENGMASTESAFYEHTANTNGNDAALAADGKVDETKLNPEFGIWFSGSADATAPADDSMGALPFDTYRIEELSVPANDGLDLVSFDVTVRRDALTIELGCVSDAETIQPQISTSLESDGGGKLAAACETVELVDTVTYNNLDTTATYQLVGSIHLVEDGVAGEQIASSGIEFSPSTTHGTVQVPFSGIDTSLVEGAKLVCFESLLDADGAVIASHEDPEDEGQTVSVPAIGTELTDSKTGGHTATFGEIGAFELVDTVSYTGLMPGKTYTVSGVLVDKETGSAIVNAEGEPVVASTDFTPESPDGSIEVSFAFAAPNLEGRSIVAFESLLHRGVEYAVHADIADESQTVSVPKVSTALTDADTGEHVVPSVGSVSLVDEVTYENLVPGATYTAIATLYDRSTGTPILVEGTAQDGQATANPLNASVEFTPETSAGSVEVRFDLEATTLTGATVCTERIVDAEGRLAAVHEDLADDGQTVTQPSMGTTLVDAESGLHLALASGTYQLVDTVSYEGLKPGKSYTAYGTLHFKDTGAAVTDESGSAIEAACTFTPETSQGTAYVPFKFETEELAGQAIVAFETIEADGRAYAEHADLDDESQTVRMPSIGTTLVDAESGEHMALASGSYQLVDTVSYEGLEPDRMYTVEGRLIDAETANAVENLDGEEVIALSTFTPAAQTGTVDVAFNFKADTMPETVVAFERIYADDELVAAHEDADDTAQTIRIPRISTTALDASSGKHETGANDQATIIDSVAYRGLEPGRMYRLKGTLMDKQTAACATGTQGDIAVVHDFQAAETSGNEQLSFELSGVNLSGKAFVVFEELYLVDSGGSETLVGAHADLDDENQTVRYHVPTLGDTFDKTGYWLLQHWWIAVLASLAILACGLLLLGRRNAWTSRTVRHAAHARRRSSPSE